MCSRPGISRAACARSFFRALWSWTKSDTCRSRATVLTSNKSFEEWGNVFGDEVMAAALIDRLLHHCHIVNIRGNSYRLRHHAGFARADVSQGPRGSAPTPQ